jgi:hypothetical protein
MRSLQTRFGNSYAGRVANTYQGVQRQPQSPAQTNPPVNAVIQRDWEWDGTDWGWKAPPDKPTTTKPTAPPTTAGTSLASPVSSSGPVTVTPTPPVTPTPTPVVTQFDTWPECYAVLDAPAKKGYDQFVTLNGQAKALPIIEGACKDRKANKYDKPKADAIWSKKAMTDIKFAQEVANKEKADAAVVTERLKTLNHLCSETDGTNRPGSVGDGTSEWALLWEAEHGEPFRSPAGHAYKLSDYCKVLKEGMAEIQAKQSAIKDAPTLLEIQTLIARATLRYSKMNAALLVWNDRVARYPAMWNPDGTSKLTPPGVDPLAKNKLEAGWPKDAKVPVF